ncbi:unnamed protein product [Musa acuminata subsp. malaccensis]|uniref:(wild Malaysian banana) hypothetical protein n=1 Tax=Musa acuminata subsp. malaccensis TaxID=214687 RepID=A0A804K281_MUSAM|nr:unnamed protein product [Musa acuminata subsp. malaccensis]
MQATTPVDPCVLGAMLPFYLARFGNPRSAPTLRLRVRVRRRGCPWRSSSLGGATESNNVSVEGLMRFAASGTSSPPTTRCRHAIRPDTGPVSVIAVNNEIGVVQLLDKMGIGLISLRMLAHPVICRHFRVRVEPQMSGGGQERVIRSGTVHARLAVGMGTAC